MFNLSIGISGILLGIEVRNVSSLFVLFKLVLCKIMFYIFIKWFCVIYDYILSIYFVIGRDIKFKLRSLFILIKKEG